MAIDAVCVVTILFAHCRLQTACIPDSRLLANRLAILGAEKSFVLCGKLLFMNNTEK